MWNYHPSLPIKNMHMIEDITEMHGNMLLWSCLGSGAIGLPYLALEAEGAVEPRMRLYGYMNDREFCGECRKRGIRPLQCSGRHSYGNLRQNGMKMKHSCWL